MVNQVPAEYGDDSKAMAHNSKGMPNGVPFFVG